LFKNKELKLDYYRIIKIDFDSVISVDQSCKNGSLKRKRLQNLRNHLAPANNVSNENIPKKLFSERASLPISQFRIEIKSKFHSLVLPSQNMIESKAKLENNSENEVDFDRIKSNPLRPDENNSASPLENDYVNLNCKIVNRKLVLVPPIRVFVPYNYPDANPIVDIIQLEEFSDDMLPGYSKFN
jgi:hypothetical protein